MQSLESANVISQISLKTFRHMRQVIRLEEEDLRRKTLLKTIEEGCEGGGILFFCFLLLSGVFTTFLSDAGGNLELGINLEWPFR